MTYTVLSWMLNSSIPYHTIASYRSDEEKNRQNVLLQLSVTDVHVRCEGNDTSETVQQSDTVASACSMDTPSTDDSLHDFNSFQFWRIQPDVVNELAIMSACGDSLQSLVISDSKEHSSPLHAAGDSVQLQLSQGLPDSICNVRESTYFKFTLCVCVILIC